MAALPVVSQSILRTSDKISARFDWLCVPQDMLILDNRMFNEWALVEYELSEFITTDKGERDCCELSQVNLLSKHR